MKKLSILAISIFAMSTTAMAATSGTSVDGHYVIPLTINLDLSSIDFGDVWTDSIVAAESVEATVTGENGETFTYKITSKESLIKIVDNYNTENTTMSDPLTLADATPTVIPFTVGLNTSGLTENQDIDTDVTVTVIYNDIAGTTSA
ncbi:hypothetical protein Ping_3053 [Psychromonas ingrahamii 37]|uniref:Uncharacterized protein n=1 Tax=Psychromonas ingrahamii (strain DSM 17664 / CCUG 51855 / 37) TaxID=357804 RepID=A1SZ38_PSYIN|nr:hypothetical protein [Psychromonas ingrahamii]ABM04753.1 hypothetical protein Ping_3053 [Psychromonas ingrahamii 37]